MTSRRISPEQRRSPPPPGDIRPFRFPDFTRRSLDSGLTVYLAPLPHVPLVHLELVTPGGALHDPPGAEGLATLTAALMDEGTDRMGALEIATSIEELGGYLSTQADWDASYAAIAVGSRHLGPALDLLTSVSTSPAFPPREIERLRRQRLAELRRRLAQPGYLAGTAFARAVYGNLPYGHSLLGTPASVTDLSRDQIVAFNRQHVAPRGASLIAVGDLEPEAMLSAIEASFASWEGTAVPLIPSTEPPAADGIRIRVVDRRGAPQTELRLGHAGVPRSHPDFSGLRVLNALLGGKFTSRINLNLRERHGFTYGAHSRFTGRLGCGPFVVATSVANQVVGRAVAETLDELRRLRREPVTETELRETKSYLLGVFPFTVQRLGDVASRLEELAIHSLPDEYFQTYHQEIEAVDAAAILDLARRHLHPDRLVVAAVGPATGIVEQLEELGPVEVAPALAGLEE